MNAVTAKHVLVADDDPIIREILAAVMVEMGCSVIETATAFETLNAAVNGVFDFILLDLRFPDCSDLSLLQKIRTTVPAIDVILITAEVDDMDIVREATRLGVFDYVPKPIREDDIRIRVTRLMAFRELSRQHARVVNELAKGHEVINIVGESAGMASLIGQIRNLACYDTPVLVVGETGTGKELVARALHNSGPRRGKPFIPVNCAALPEQLTESELFGHEKGAFTGAHACRCGAFEEAEDGTIFLDEIGDMRGQAQASLLHILETGVYRSVGGKEKRSQARVVLATHQNLEELVQQGLFRKDLFYRINRLQLRTPPLRERRDDIRLLAHHFFGALERKVGKGLRGIDPKARELLMQYDWPGNVRELKNEIERAYIYAEGPEIRQIDFSAEIFLPRVTLDTHGEMSANSLDELCKLVEALRSCGGNISKAAGMLGVHRNTIHRWMKKYDLD